MDKATGERKGDASDRPQNTRREQPADLRADNLLKEGRHLFARADKGPTPKTLEFTNPYQDQAVTPAKGDSLGSLGPKIYGADRSGAPEKVTSFTVRGDLSKIDNKKPTVAFLDSTDALSARAGEHAIDHPYVSALSAQKAGYNAVVLDMQPGNRASDAFQHTYKQEHLHGKKNNPTERENNAVQSGVNAAVSELDSASMSRNGLDEGKQTYEGVTAKFEKSNQFSTALNELAGKVKSGELPMGKGDVVNISLGNNAEHYDNGRAVPGTGNPTYQELNKALKLGVQINENNVSQLKPKILERLREIAGDKKNKFHDQAAGAVQTNDAIKQVQQLGIEVIHSASNDGNDRVDIDFLSVDHELKSVNPKNGKTDKFSGWGDTAGDGVVAVKKMQTDSPSQTYDLAGQQITNDEVKRIEDSLPQSKEHVKDRPGKVYMGDGDYIKAQQKEVDWALWANARRPQGPDAHNMESLSFGNSFVNIDYLKRNYDRLLAKKRAAAEPSSAS